MHKRILQTIITAIVFIGFSGPVNAQVANYIYDDSIQNSWTDWSWQQDINYTNTSPVSSGAYSAAWTPTAQWDTFGIRESWSIDNPIPLQPYAYVEFDVYKAGTGNTYGVRLMDQSGVLTDYVYLDSNIPANTWTTVTIPLSDFYSPDWFYTDLYNVRITVTNSNISGETLYIDELGLGGVGPPIPTPEPLNINASVYTSTTIHPFNDEMLGVGLVNWAHYWGWPFPTQVPGLAQAFEAAEIKLIRYAGGNWANDICWDREIQNASGGCIANANYDHRYGIDEIDDVAAFAKSIDAHVMMQVNINTDNAAMWADLVQYTNDENITGSPDDFVLEDGSPIFKYWEIGNEFNLGVWDGNTPGVTASVYASRLPSYITQMKAEDSSIQIIAGVPAGAHGSPYVHNWDDNYTALSDYLIFSAQISGVDSISHHWYQNGNTQSISDMFAFAPSDVSPSPSSEINWRNRYLRDWTRIVSERIDNEIINVENPNLTQGITEFNFDAQDFGIAPQNANHANAVWAADTLGRSAYYGTDYVTWYTGYGRGDYTGSGTQSHSQGYSMIDALIPNWMTVSGINLRPSYYTFFMFGNYFGDQMVESVSNDESHLSVWASTDSDDPGKLKLMVVNTHAEVVTSSITISPDFNANNSADVYEMVSADPTNMSDESHDNHSTTINGVTLNSMDVASSAATIVPETQAVSGNVLTRVFPAYSVTSIILSENGSPSPASSNFYFNPSTISTFLLAGRNVSLMLNASTNEIDTITATLTFDNSKINLTSSLEATPPFQIVSTTPLTTANSTGRAEIQLQLINGQPNPSGVIPVANFNIKSVATTNASPGLLSVDLGTSEVRDIYAQLVPLNVTDLSFNIDLLASPNDDIDETTTTVTVIKVIDNNEDPIEGAEVKNVKGATYGETDEDGELAIPGLDTDDGLIIEYNGISKEINLNTQDQSERYIVEFIDENENTIPKDLLPSLRPAQAAIILTTIAILIAGTYIIVKKRKRKIT